MNEKESHPLRHDPLTKVVEQVIRRRTYVERQDKVGMAIEIAEAVLLHINEPQTKR